MLYSQYLCISASSKSEECDSILLGSLLRLLLEFVLHTIPAKPFGATTIDRLLGKDGIRTPGIIGLHDHSLCKAAAVAMQMNLGDEVEKFVNSLGNGVGGVK